MFARKRPEPTTPETAPTPAENVNAPTARWTASRRATVVLGWLAFVMVVLGGAASTARPVPVEQRSFGLGLRTGAAAQAPGCVPVPGAECGSVRVPLFWSRPAGPTINVAYVLIRHRDQSLPSARGTVLFNPGGPGIGVIADAAMWAGALSGVLNDHDLLLIDPRGTGRSHPLACGVTAVPATRDGLTRVIGDCSRRLGRQARAYTSAATADDFEAVRKHLGIPKLDLYGVSYGTYLMTVFAQRHPKSVRSIVLSSAFPLQFDMWGRANARALRLAIRRVCPRSTTGKCDGTRTLRQLARLARRLHAHPIPYRLNGERRVIDETALAGIAYWSATGFKIGQLPAIVRSALHGDNRPLISAARSLASVLFSGSQATGGGQNDALTASVECNDYPTLWDRRAPIPVRLRQFAARRARLPQAAFWPFSVRAWTSAITVEGFDVMNVLMTRHSPRSACFSAARRGRLEIHLVSPPAETLPLRAIAPAHQSAAAGEGLNPEVLEPPGPLRRPDCATTPSRGQPYSSDGRTPTQRARRVGGQRSARTAPESVCLLVGGLQWSIAMLPLVAEAMARRGTVRQGTESFG